MPVDSAPPRRAPRRDAVRNDRRVLDAARAVFADRGPGASMEDIARAAGVGVGTIYRRFPSKDALLDAIAELFMSELDRAADDALDADDAGAALTAFLEFVGAFHAEKRHYAAAFAARAGDEGAGDAVYGKLARLTRRAVAAGALAPGVGEADIRALIVALQSVVAAAADDRAWQRFLHIHLAGLRAFS